MRHILLTLSLLLLAACTTPTAVPTLPPTPALNPATLPLEQGRFFNGSGNCAACHTNMRDQAGADVSTDRLWRGTMLANAARDPYWLATVRSEVVSAPALSATIQKKCATCHMPMAEFSAVANGEAPMILDRGFNAPQHPLNRLALDGVSCSLCHQIQDGNFGQPASFSGGFQVDPALAQGQRLAYGPNVVARGMSMTMQGSSGFIPTTSAHLAKGELCGTCHDLYTPYLDDQGQVAGQFPEQMIYSEWANSAYRGGNCQSCHMPQAQGGVQVAITGGPARSPFFQHSFVGGNAFMGRILGQNAQALALNATPAQFESIAALAQAQIEQKTASLSLEQVKIAQNRLTAQVRVASQVGHKFPGGFPSRRAWLHITLRDAKGQVVFETGAVRPDGAIEGNANDSDPAQFEPHYARLNAPGQVQIYEAIMLDLNGKLTTTLLRGAAYAKDNRLLPAGFDLKAAGANIAVHGVSSDPDFLPGQDLLALDLNLGAAQGPFTLQAELLYQTIGYRWAANITEQNSAEAKTFANLYRATTNTALAAARAEVQGIR